MLPKRLETPGSDDDDDNDQLSGLDDSVDEALIVCRKNTVCCVVLECAGDVCLYTLVVCSELLFAVAFSTRCNCCDSYFVSFNSTLLQL